jgi:CBS domain-containing protein
MKVAEIMVGSVDSCRAGDALDAVARIMWEKDCGAVPVVDDRSIILGMITDRDVCMATYTQGRPPGEIPVSSAMSKGLWWCSPEDDLSRAEEMMRTHQIRRLPVADKEGRLVGILSLADIAREAAREEGGRKPRKQVNFDEVGRLLSAISKPRFPSESQLRVAS